MGNIIAPSNSAISLSLDTLTQAAKGVSTQRDQLQTALAYNKANLDYKGLGEMVEAFRTNETKLAETTTEINLKKLISPDFSLVKQLINTLGEGAQNFASLTKEARNRSLPSFNFQADAQNKLKLTSDILNETLNGRFLTGGSVTNEQIVDITKLPNINSYNLNDTDIVAKPAYYNGDNFDKSVELLGQYIFYAFRADESPFQQYLKAQNIMANADPNAANYKTYVDEACRCADLALEGIRNIQMEIGTVDSLLEGAMNQLTENANTCTDQLFELNGVDRQKLITEFLELSQIISVFFASISKTLETSQIACNRILGN